MEFRKEFLLFIKQLYNFVAKGDFLFFFWSFGVNLVKLINGAN